ncbi:MAG: HEAT repeat domain-containing protein [Chloroflexi bacterium]|nr:HEAT repeat domain-containing protein [Chloroflexota bacterium]
MNRHILALQDADAPVRMKAAKALGKLKDVLALEPLILVALDDSDPAVRKSATVALDQLDGGKERLAEASARRKATQVQDRPRQAGGQFLDLFDFAFSDTPEDAKRRAKGAAFRQWQARQRKFLEAKRVSLAALPGICNRKLGPFGQYLTHDGQGIKQMFADFRQRLDACRLPTDLSQEEASRLRRALEDVELLGGALSKETERLLQLAEARRLEAKAKAEEAERLHQWQEQELVGLKAEQDLLAAIPAAANKRLTALEQWLRPEEIKEFQTAIVEFQRLQHATRFPADLTKESARDLWDHLRIVAGQGGVLGSLTEQLISVAEARRAEAEAKARQKAGDDALDKESAELVQQKARLQRPAGRAQARRLWPLVERLADAAEAKGDYARANTLYERAEVLKQAARDNEDHKPAFAPVEGVASQRLWMQTVTYASKLGLDDRIIAGTLRSNMPKDGSELRPDALDYIGAAGLTPQQLMILRGYPGESVELAKIEADVVHHALEVAPLSDVGDLAYLINSIRPVGRIGQEKRRKLQQVSSLLSRHASSSRSPDEVTETRCDLSALQESISDKEGKFDRREVVAAALKSKDGATVRILIALDDEKRAKRHECLAAIRELEKKLRAEGFNSHADRVESLLSDVESWSNMDDLCAELYRLIV